MAEYQGKYKSVYNPGIEIETDDIAREAALDLMYHNQGPLTEYDLNDLPPADVRSEGEIDEAVYEAILVLNAIISSGSIDYEDYCKMYEAISSISRLWSRYESW